MDKFLGGMDGRYAPEKKTVLSLCNNRDGYTLSELGRIMGVSIPKISRIVGEMVRDGYMVEKGKLHSEGGRRAGLYGLNPDAGFFVGVEVGQETITIAVTDFPGHTVTIVDDVPFCLVSSEESVRQLCGTIIARLAKAGVEMDRVRSAGIALTGRVNHVTGYTYSYFISDEKPLRSLLEQYLGCKVTVENDSRAMAYGEYVSGVAGNEGTALFLNVGLGLGMGMVMDGKLFYGRSGFSGEIGHFPLLDNNVFCRCGKIGCLETGASGLALQRLFVEKMNEGRPSVLSESYKNGRKISMDDILDALKKEDMAAMECIEEVGATLGRAVAGLINIFNPELVVIGGRLSVAERYLMPPLRSAVNKLSLNLVNKDTQIKVSQLGKNAGAIGASLLAKDSILGEID